MNMSLFTSLLIASASVAAAFPSSRISANSSSASTTLASSTNPPSSESRPTPSTIESTNTTKTSVGSLADLSALTGYGTTWPSWGIAWTQTDFIAGPPVSTGIIGDQDPRYDEHLLNPYMMLLLSTVPRPVDQPGDLNSSEVVEMLEQYHYCSPIYDAYLLDWAKTEPFTQAVVPRTIVPVGGNEAPDAGVLHGKHEFTQWSSWASPTPQTTGPSRVFTWTVQEPCCKQCSLFGGSVQVYYWPKTQFHNMTATSIVSNDFTFVYPSLYVGFQEVSASNYCGDIGLMNHAPTLAFAPGDLSTLRSFQFDPIYRTAPADPSLWVMQPWEEKTKCDLITTSFYQVLGQGGLFTASADASTGVYLYNLYIMSRDGASATLLSWSDAVEYYTVSYNPCSPIVQIPKSKFALTNPVNSAVTYCDGNFAFYDPPSALTRAPAPMTSAVPIKSSTTTSQAVPGSGPAPTIATATAVPTPQEQVTSSSSEEKPSKNTSVAVEKPTQTIPQDPTTSKNDAEPNSPVIESHVTPADKPTTSTAADTNVEPTVAVPHSDDKPATTAPTKTNVFILTIVTASYTKSSVDGTKEQSATTEKLVPAPALTESKSTSDPAPAGFASLIASLGGFAQGSTPTSVVAGSVVTLDGDQVASIGADEVVVQAPGGIVKTISAAIEKPAKSPTTYVIADPTLVAGGNAATVSGTVVSLLDNGESIVIGSSTAALIDYLETTSTSAVEGKTSNVGAAGSSSTIAHEVPQIEAPHLPSSSTYVSSSADTIADVDNSSTESTSTESTQTKTKASETINISSTETTSAENSQTNTSETASSSSNSNSISNGNSTEAPSTGSAQTETSQTVDATGSASTLVQIEQGSTGIIGVKIEGKSLVTSMGLAILYLMFA